MPTRDIQIELSHARDDVNAIASVMLAALNRGDSIKPGSHVHHELIRRSAKVMALHNELMGVSGELLS